MSHKKKTEPRFCKMCGIDISDSPSKQKLCRPCAYVSCHNKPKPETRNCVRCGCDIMARHPSAKYCTKCAREVQEHSWAARYKPQPRDVKKCGMCGVDITHKANNAKYCDSCGALRKSAATHGVPRDAVKPTQPKPRGRTTGLPATCDGCRFVAYAEIKSWRCCDYRLVTGHGRGMTVEECTLREAGVHPRAHRWSGGGEGL
jgi:hypothetical protein